MVGYFTRTPDDRSLVRGVTYTIMPDGESVRVPVMNRRDVRAAAQMHTGDEGHDMMEALKDILGGRKPMMGRAHFDRRGRAVGGRSRARHMGSAERERGGKWGSGWMGHHSWAGVDRTVRPTSIIQTSLSQGSPAYIDQFGHPSTWTRPELDLPGSEPIRPGDIPLSN